MTSKQLQRENQRLRVRLAEAEEALHAIRGGQVDAIVVDGRHGAQIFSLAGAETVYRLVVETMGEAVLNVTPGGKIMFCNARFGEFVATPVEQLLGRQLADFVPHGSRKRLHALLQQCLGQPIQERIVFRAAKGSLKPMHLTGHALSQIDGISLCLVAADLSGMESSARKIGLLREHERVMEEVEAKLRESQRAALNLTEDAVAARTAAVQSATELQTANVELEHFNRVMVGREVRMIELKKEINALCEQLGQTRRFPLEFEKAGVMGKGRTNDHRPPAENKRRKTKEPK